MDYFNRELAAFPLTLWSAIDEAAVRAARERLTARRFLDVEGPFGVGLTAIEVGDDEYRQAQPTEAAAVISRTVSVPMLRRSFRLSIRRIAAHVEYGQAVNLSPVADAAEAVADAEERMVYSGQPDFGLPGLLAVTERQHVDGGAWSALDRALQDTLAAATKLDERGFRGPYSLVLAPALYNALFRLYPGTDVLQLEHLRRLCTGGIYKASIEGGVLIDPRVGVLVVGQDLRSGYVGQDGTHYQLYVSESLALRIDEPNAICTLSASL
ncbi:MAG TPA: family 1 encapsulin nanocompartment shell protein [Stellaceae bacterium]